MELLDAVEDFIEEMGYLDNDNVLGIFLYGSSLTGYATEGSDVDIHVITQNTSILIRGVKNTDGYKFEYFEKPLEDLYLTLENEFNSQNNALLPMIGNGRIVFSRSEKVRELQKAVLLKHSNPLPPIDLEIAKEKVVIIYTRVNRLQKMLDKNHPSFMSYHGIVLEKIKDYYHRLLGCPEIPPEKTIEIYTDENYRNSFCKGSIPEREFTELYKNVLYSNTKEEIMSSIWELFNYSRRNVDIDPENYRIRILSRNDPNNLNHK